MRSDEATWALEYLYDEKGTATGGIYSAEGTSAAFLVVATDRGDVRELLDADGHSFAFYSYDAYGNPGEKLMRATARVPTALAAQIAERNVLRYAGYCYDEMSGLYYLSQRYYDPESASFISKDPARADGEESAYQYCAGDPVGKVDPTGLRYDPVAALLYAKRWSSRYDPFWHWTKGRSCTQFLSTLLYAGGFREQYYSCHGRPLYWWATQRQASKYWASASDAFWYLTSKRKLTYRRYRKKDIPSSGNKKNGYIAWARQGDAVFYRHEGGKRIHHAAVIVATNKANGTLRGQHLSTWGFDVRGTKSGVKPRDYIYIVRIR
ncbi:MAG: RHS repeat-associated core domain-containing protein [Coriobacteriia bacterium]